MVQEELEARKQTSHNVDRTATQPACASTLPSDVAPKLLPSACSSIVPLPSMLKSFLTLIS